MSGEVYDVGPGAFMSSAVPASMSTPREVLIEADLTGEFSSPENAARRVLVALHVAGYEIVPSALVQAVLNALVSAPTTPLTVAAILDLTAYREQVSQP